MKGDSEYKDYIIEDVLGHISGISAKAMFSGWGIYLDGSIVGIIVDGELYLKANSDTVQKYKQLGCCPFSYDRKGKQIEMSYMSVPLDMLENRDMMQSRIDESYVISVNKHSK